MSSKTYLSPVCSCIHCREVKSAKGIHSHYLTAHTKEGNLRAKNAFRLASQLGVVASAKKANAVSEVKKNNYLVSPNLCKQCSNILPYKQRNNKFCSKSCSASHSNKERIDNGYTVSNETKQKTSNTLRNKPSKSLQYSKIFKCRKCKKFHQSAEIAKQCCPLKRSKKIRQPKLETVGAFSKICLCVCKVCKTSFCNKTQKQFCTNCKIFHSDKRSEFRFKFNLFDYPDLFDLTKLSQIGFYGPGGKSQNWNIEGLSRDHKVSVSEAIANNYNPYYISHPCNCELMPHRENDKKKGKSSITYSSLIELVDSYEKQKVERPGVEPGQAY